MLVSSSCILRCSPCIHPVIVLSEGFREGTTTDLRAEFPENEERYRDDYEYSSDSDLEDDPIEVTSLQHVNSSTTLEAHSDERKDIGNGCLSGSDMETDRSQSPKIEEGYEDSNGEFNMENGNDHYMASPALVNEGLSLR